jgi:hypothetical protein
MQLSGAAEEADNDVSSHMMMALTNKKGRI